MWLGLACGGRVLVLTRCLGRLFPHKQRREKENIVKGVA